MNYFPEVILLHDLDLPFKLWKLLRRSTSWWSMWVVAEYLASITAVIDKLKTGNFWKT